MMQKYIVLLNLSTNKSVKRKAFILQLSLMQEIFWKVVKYVISLLSNFIVLVINKPLLLRAAIKLFVIQNKENKIGIRDFSWTM